MKRFLLCALLLTSPSIAQDDGDLLTRARAALDAGQPAEAETLYRDLRNRAPGLVDAHRGLAEALAAQDRRSEAARVLGELGAGLLAAGQNSVAAEVLGAAVELAPAAAELLALHGKALAFDRRHPEAIAPLERARELGDARPATRLYLAAALWESGRTAEAETHYRALLEARPDDFVTLHQFGRLLLWLGRATEAAVPLARAAALRPAAFDVAHDLARARHEAGDLETALTAYRRAVELAPDHPQVRYGLARVLLRLGDHEAAREAMEVYQELYAAQQEATRRENLERARLDHGWELLEHGEYEAAERHFATLTVGVETLAGRAAAAAALGEHGAAVEWLERAVALAPDRPDLRRRLDEERLLSGGT